MTTAPLTAGKLRGLSVLADRRGVFTMIAVDQRPPLFAALARHDGRRPEQVRFDEVAAVKRSLTRVLAPHASAILIDPVWTHPHALLDVPGDVGLISTLEDYAFELQPGAPAGERLSAPIEGWSVAKSKSSGAQGVKLLAWDRPDASAATLRAQEDFVRGVGDACREHDIPFVLELLIYPFTGEDGTSLEYARRKPERVLRSVERFRDDAFGVDLLKLEFPADMKRVREFSAGAFGGGPRDAAYGLDDVRGWLREMDAMTNVPWVLLSAGVGPAEFQASLELAFEAGASGFLAGRAVWMDALDAYPDLDALEGRLRSESVPYLRRISALAERARPWSEHRRYGGAPRLADAGEGWHRRYGAPAAAGAGA